MASRQSWIGVLLASPPILLIIVFIGFPVINAFGLSLGYTGGLNTTIAMIGKNTHETQSWAPTLDAYREVFSNPRFLSDLRVTVSISILTTVIVTALAWLVALAMRLRPSGITRMLPAFAVIPMFIPGVIGAWAMIRFWAADGFFGSAMRSLGVASPPQIAFTSTLVLMTQVWSSLPFAVLMVSSGVQSVPDALIDAARDAGAGTVRIVKDVVAPMAFVPTVIAMTFTAIGNVGSFTVPWLTGPSAPTMLGVSMTKHFNTYGEPQQSVVMAIVVFALAALIGVLYVWANYRQAKEEMT
ncbi:sugar ABC transporter permease [Dermabacter hominis]|uniref:ABC transporter permease n=1 Tax=Dermabacter hominis TaxID=36740 RepID=UPI0021A56CD4|nr:sugar ABC transporter permease [Dermabacter hominis]MDU2058065.1 sugar ABC transporter permease [Dermabacter sp.]MCT1955382.1 sugar ABC transporter permease [Dermabacter hominis]MCT2055782.1 sugar ABC transporter permease [Dermabacter hominis]MCT2083449.1 sugar ABC transporter permease [Dermabacter hominis]MCT2090701.1 sugar ABC transporter permease [Dermabacter hominis]